MAEFTRKQLEELGISPENIDTIINMHVGVTDFLKAERDKYKAEAEGTAVLKSRIDELEKTKSDIEDYKGRYEAEKAAHDKLKSDIAIQAETEKKTAAAAKLLRDNGYHEKGISKIIKYSGLLDKMELDVNGNIKDGEKLLADEVDREWGEFKGKTEKFEHIPGGQLNDGGRNNQPSRASEIYTRIHENMFG